MAEEPRIKMHMGKTTPPILFRCAEDALAAAMEQALAGMKHLTDQIRGTCPLCDEADQRCHCWEDDS